MTSPISGGDKLTVVEEESANEYIRNHGGSATLKQGYGESESTAAATYSKEIAYALGSIGIPLLMLMLVCLMKIITKYHWRR